MNGRTEMLRVYDVLDATEPDYKALYDDAMRRLLKAHQTMGAMAQETAVIYNAYRALVIQNEMRP